MGWLFSTEWMNRDALVAHLVSPGEADKRRTLAKSLRGNHLWVVQEYEDSAGQRVRFIAVYLLQGGGRDGWGYKGVEEGCGPCEKDCPLHFFELVPQPGGNHGAAWREEVRAYHAKQRASRAKLKGLKEGDELHLPEGCTPRVLKITSVNPLQGVAGGVVYRVQPRYVKLAEIVPAT